MCLCARHVYFDLGNFTLEPVWGSLTSILFGISDSTLFYILYDILIRPMPFFFGPALHSLQTVCSPIHMAWQRDGNYKFTIAEAVYLQKHFPILWFTSRTQFVKLFIWSMSAACYFIFFSRTITFDRNSICNSDRKLHFQFSYFTQSFFWSWVIIDIIHCISLSCMMCSFNTFIYCDMITTVVLGDTSIT